MAERHHLTLTLISARRRPSAEQTPFVAAGRLQQIAGIATKHRIQQLLTKHTHTTVLTAHLNGLANNRNQKVSKH